jgi:hypothetical protein
MYDAQDNLIFVFFFVRESRPLNGQWYESNQEDSSSNCAAIIKEGKNGYKWVKIKPKKYVTEINNNKNCRER